MKLFDALNRAITEMKDLLTSAGLVEGITLTQEDLKNSRGVLFWFIEVKSEEASRKSTYATFNVTTIESKIHADGSPVSCKVTVELNIFTNKEDISILMNDLNNTAEAEGWTFDLASAPSYDSQSKLYNYNFKLGKHLYDAE